MKSISIDELISILPNDNVIDIRDNYEYNLGSIPNAKNIPMNFLIMNPDDYLKKDEKYYIYCGYGNRSKRCALTLSNMGYDVVNITGGYNAYNLFMHTK